MKNLRFAVIGLGALGGYYGGLLAKSGREVHFLARSNRDAVIGEGLRVDSPGGSFHLRHVNVYDRPEAMPKCDVVLISLKATDNAALTSILPHVLTESGTTLLIQNGLGQEERLPEVALRGSVYAGLGFICAHKAKPNHIVHEDYGTLRVAVYHEARSAQLLHGGVEGLARELRDAGIEIELEPEFLLARWKKLVWNIPFNGLAVALRSNTAELMRGRNSSVLVRQLMLEVIAAGRSVGCAIADEYAQEMLDGTERMRPYFPSMYHDFQAGRALELEAMYWIPIERARQPMPRVEMLARQLEHLSARRSGTH
ncbi:MAG: 2-dehydropantoate 2-reductase [Myxococcales bacterium]